MRGREVGMIEVVDNMMCKLGSSRVQRGLVRDELRCKCRG